MSKDTVYIVIYAVQIKSLHLYTCGKSWTKLLVFPYTVDSGC